MTAGERLGFCQNCGQPLNQHTIRAVGAAVYCEPCLEARLAGTIPTPHQPGAAHVPPYTPVSGAPTSGFVPSPVASLPNPALAAVLGCIPGVGAMYNGQYAKGLVHLMVFAVLVSLTNASGLFGLFVMGWIGYMVIEAHHTAKARRDGTPLPNPFGLNDLSERLGFGKAWPSGTPHPQAAASNTSYPQDFTTPPGATAYPTAATPWTPGSASAAVVTETAEAASAGSTPFYTYAPSGATPFTPPPYAPPAPDDTSFSQSGSVFQGSASLTTPPLDPIRPHPHQGSRFPIGAIWLIGLGLFFFLATTGLFNGIPGRALAGFAFIGLGLWLFLRRLVEPSSNRSVNLPHTLRLARALRGSAWVILVGVLFLLDEFHILGWNRSWPLFIIMAGVIMIMERLAHNLAATQPFADSPTPLSGPATPDPFSERRF